MTPGITFSYGLALLILLGWYFATDIDARKRNIGTVLTVLLMIFCFICIYPPFDVKDASGKIIKTGKIHLGLDLQGGTSFLVRLNPPPDESGQPKVITPEMVDQAVEAFRKRMDPYGTSEPIIIPQGTDSILVQIPGLHDAGQVEEARKELKQVAKLEFKLVHPDNAEWIQAIDAGQKAIPPGYSIETFSTDRNGKHIDERLLIERKSSLDGSHVTRAGASYQTEGWVVWMSFDSTGAEEFAKLTKQVADEHTEMAIELDGKVMSSATVDYDKFGETGIVGGQAEISGGSMSDKEAHGLATALENPLQTPVEIMDTRSSSATLGADSIRSGIYSALAGLILVAIFMIIYYHVVGFIAIVALVINCVMVVGALAMFNSVLTLPGIAGLILSLGIAIDANVLIYERLREELDHGKTIRPAVDASYSKAFSAIFDAHVTQFLTAAVLFWLASGPVKGFALTLTIGIVASMFSSLLITYTCFSWIFAADMLKKITMLHLIRSQAFDFVGHAGKFRLISVLLVIGSIAVVGLRGDKNLGADFRGGDQIIFTAKNKITPDDVRKALLGTPYASAVIQEQKSASEDLISIRSDFNTADKIKALLDKNLGLVEGNRGDYRSASQAGAPGGGVMFTAKNKITPDDVRKALSGTPYASAAIQEEKSATNEDLISINCDPGAVEKIKALLDKNLGLSEGIQGDYRATTQVGALVGRELATRSALALSLGLVCIFVYVSVRFETSFAIGSIVALAHDLIIVIGIFAFSGRELSLIMVGALLSIAGYSINDKVVVFDRIRSGLRDHPGGNVASIINTSINETLSRTILTGGTALLTVVALYLFGGPVLNDFAFSFVWGIIIGTYSSIFIASPIVLWWSGRRGRSLRTEVTKQPITIKA